MSLFSIHTLEKYETELNLIKSFEYIYLILEYIYQYFQQYLYFSFSVKIIFIVKFFEWLKILQESK